MGSFLQGGTKASRSCPISAQRQVTAGKHLCRKTHEQSSPTGPVVHSGSRIQYF